MPLPWAERAEANLPRGESHQNWKGDAASTASKYEWTQKLYPLEGVICEDCGERPALHRHHKDKDIGNTRRYNIELICIPCHVRRHPPYNKRITTEDGFVAIEMRATGSSRSEIALQLKISLASVDDIIYRRRRWINELPERW